MQIDKRIQFSKVEGSNIDGKKSGGISDKPLKNPKIGDMYAVEVEDYDRTVTLVKNGKTHKEYFMWNGVGYACVQPDKEENVTITE